MDYDLRCEGFPLDDDLRDRLLLSGRRFVLEHCAERTVKMSVKQIDGLVLGRVEILLPARRLEVIVRRRDPVSALSAAMETAREAIEELDGC